jgi:hypothetical protein
MGNAGTQTHNPLEASGGCGACEFMFATKVGVGSGHEAVTNDSPHSFDNQSVGHPAIILVFTVQVTVTMGTKFRVVPLLKRRKTIGVSKLRPWAARTVEYVIQQSRATLHVC